MGYQESDGIMGFLECFARGVASFFFFFKKSQDEFY